ncbi:MAG: hypothetical protein SFX73_28810 [Kofleriaceae bacterium]|nr:hypothetical protein [Kofleriaceae bacterium]
MGDTSKFRIDRTTAPGLTMLSLHGVVEANLEGKKLASSVKTPKVLINLREVRRFASWGMAEWMNFLRATQELDLYFIECSTYAIQQISQITGLLGHGKLVSFHAPFRCGTCGEERDEIIVVAQEPAKLRELLDSVRACPACGGTSRINRHQADVAVAVTSKAGYDIDDDVAAFLRAQYKYEITPNLSKFRALRRKQGRNTFLRLSGNLGTLPAKKLALAAEGTTVIDISRVNFDPAHLTAWRDFIASASPNVDSLQLLDCPPSFFDYAVSPEDLDSPKLKVRTFVQTYVCPKCSTHSGLMIDVAQQLEELIGGVLPSHRCPSCKFEIPPPFVHGPIQRLPARERDHELDRFIDKVRHEPDDKLENALAARVTKKSSGVATQRTVFIGSALAAVLVGAIVLVVMFVFKKDAPVVTAQPTPRDPGPQFQRPEWILSDTPSSAYCQEMIGRMMCVGVSPYGTDRDAAVIAANDAAIDELVNLVGIRISDDWFRDNVLAGYSSARTKALAAMQNAGPRADDPSVRAVRHKVAELFLASGGPSVPAQRSDWYWEEYERGGGKGTEFLVFVRYDVSVEALSALVKRYGATSSLSDSTILTAFPGLAWQYPGFAGGVMLSTVKGALASAGFKPLQVITAVNETALTDALQLIKQLSEGKGTELVLTARQGDGEATKIAFKP